MDAVDDSVFRILRAMFAVGTMLLPSVMGDMIVSMISASMSTGVMDEPASAWDAKKRLNNVTTEASLASARHDASRHP